GAYVSASARAQGPHPAVLQLDVWRKAVLAGDTQALTPLYTTSPRILGPGQSASNLQAEIGYWGGWEIKGLNSLSAQIETAQEPQPGFHVLALKLTLVANEGGVPRKYFIKVAQGYVEQGGTWKIAAEQREDPTRLKGPAEKKDLYPADADAYK